MAQLRGDRAEVEAMIREALEGYHKTILEGGKSIEAALDRSKETVQHLDQQMGNIRQVVSERDTETTARYSAAMSELDAKIEKATADIKASSEYHERRWETLKDELKAFSEQIQGQTTGADQRLQEAEARFSLSCSQIDEWCIKTKAEVDDKLRFGAGGGFGGGRRDDDDGGFNLVHKKDRLNKLEKNCLRDDFKHWQTCIELHLECQSGWAGATTLLRRLRLVTETLTNIKFAEIIAELDRKYREGRR